MSKRTHVYDNNAILCQKVAERLAEYARTTVAELGSFSIALSGGNTPLTLFAELRTYGIDRMPWDKVHIFWADERCVAPDHAESNFAAAHQALLQHVPVPAAQVHRIYGEQTPDKAAQEYSKTLHDHFHGAPAFDLILLGMGNDGHTASLFPGDLALQERTRTTLAIRNDHVKTPWRVTLTLPVLHAARNIWFLVSGAEKAPVVRDVLQHDDARYPATLAQRDSHALWFLDAEAARFL